MALKKTTRSLLMVGKTNKRRLSKAERSGLAQMIRQQRAAGRAVGRRVRNDPPPRPRKPGVKLSDVRRLNQRAAETIAHKSR